MEAGNFHYFKNIIYRLKKLRIVNENKFILIKKWYEK